MTQNSPKHNKSPPLSKHTYQTIICSPIFNKNQLFYHIFTKPDARFPCFPCYAHGKARRWCQISLTQAKPFLCN